jgi:hypothetical protein
MAFEGFSRFLKDSLQKLGKAAGDFFRAASDVQAPFWFLKKSIQVQLRKHTSLFLALILALAVVFRERQELLEIGKSLHLPSAFELFVLVLTVLTVFAAVWEFKGNKLTTSPQEERFLEGMRSLLAELEKFAHAQDTTPDDVDDRLALFIQGFLEITCNALCGKKKIDGGLMVRLSDRRTLVLLYMSKKANYQKGLRITIPIEGDKPDVSPAGEALAPDGPHLTYMPRKKTKRTWVFQSANMRERYTALRSIIGWKDTAGKEYEDFRSVLCIPVAVYQKEQEKLPFGVLNYSTRVRDPFVDRDFMMAECFASVLAQAFAVAHQQRLKRNSPEAQVPGPAEVT